MRYEVLVCDACGEDIGRVSHDKVVSSFMVTVHSKGPSGNHDSWRDVCNSCQRKLMEVLTQHKQPTAMPAEDQ